MASLLVLAKDMSDWGRQSSLVPTVVEMQPFEVTMTWPLQDNKMCKEIIETTVLQFAR